MADKTLVLNSEITNDQKITGWLNKNEMVAGEPLSYAFGKSANGDLIFIQKVKSGDTVRANVVISLCQYSDGFMDYIGPDVNLDRFYLNQVILGGCSSDESCKERDLEFGQFGFFSEELGSFVPVNVTGIE